MRSHYLSLGTHWHITARLRLLNHCPYTPCPCPTLVLSAFLSSSPFWSTCLHLQNHCFQHIPPPTLAALATLASRSSCPCPINPCHHCHCQHPCVIITVCARVSLQCLISVLSTNLVVSRRPKTSSFSSPRAKLHPWRPLLLHCNEIQGIPVSLVLRYLCNLMYLCLRASTWSAEEEHREDASLYCC